MAAPTKIKRFTTPDRLFHVALLVTFITQTITGLGRLYFPTSWGKSVCSLFGGYESTTSVHIWVGIFMIAVFLVHVVYALTRVLWRGGKAGLSNPDYLTPSFRDLRQWWQSLRCLFGRGEHPHFDRWTFWEKFDYWAVFWGMIILGGTGLILAFPVAASNLVPGWMLSVALLVHRLEAILAIIHIFLIHFLMTHFRPAAFPLDDSIFSGYSDLGREMAERPAWLDRLKQEGRLEESLGEAPSARARITYCVFGYLVMVTCFYFLFCLFFYLPTVKWF
jgi:cytochrome b subunit of formate dehydrogenase